MLVTLTTNIHGHERIYLGGTGSFEVWLEKADDGRHWTLHAAEGLAGTPLAEADKRAVATHRLLSLCHLLDNCSPDDLAHVPWQVIKSLHNADNREHRRMATPRRNVAEQAYMATSPNMTRPKGDFRAEHADYYRRSR